MTVLEQVFKTYDVDEYGVVVRRRDNKVIKHQLNKKGYHRVYLRSGMVKDMRVSRLVALKYLPNPCGYEEVNHKDGNKDNNYWKNLEWCSGVQNRDHALVSGLMKRGEGHRCARLKESEVVEIRKRIGAGESFKKVWGDYSDKIAWWGFRELCRGNTWKHVVVS